MTSREIVPLKLREKSLSRV